MKSSNKNNSKLQDELETLRSRVAELESNQAQQISEQERTKHLDAIRDQSNIGMGTVDLDGNLLYINKACAEMHGYGIEELLGKHLSIFHTPEQLSAVQACIQQVKETGTFYGEIWHVRKDGTVFPTLMHNSLVRDDTGKTVSMIGTVLDITERKQIEEKLRIKDFVFKSTLSADSIGSNDGILTHANPAFARIWGYENVDEVIGKPILDFHADKDEALEIIESVNNTGKWKGEYTALKKDGSTFIASSSANAVFDAEGNQTALYSSVVDITKHKQAEKERKVNSAMFENLAEGIYLIGLDDLTIKWVNPVFEEMFGYSPGEMIGKPVDIVNAPSDTRPEETRNLIVDVLKNTGSWHGEVKNIKKDGTHFWCYANVSLFEHPEFGKVFVSAHTDITERRKTEKEMRKLATVVKHSSELVNLATMDGKMIFLNEAGGRMLGIDPLEIEHVSIMDVIPEHWTEFVESDLLLTLRRGDIWEGDLQYRNLKTGNLIDVHAITFTVEDPDTKKPQFLANISRDITDRKKAEEEIQRKEVSLREAQAIAHVGSWEWDILSGKERWSEETYRIFGVRPDNFIANYDNYMNLIHPDDREIVAKAVEASVNEDKSVNVDYRIVHPDGSERIVNSRGKTSRDERGQATRVVGTCQDITERRRAEEEKVKLEEQLKQAQKMEAIGTMAGGIAHDFNNILASLRTNIEMSLRKLDPKSSVRPFLDESHKSILRAKDLVEQILIFSGHQKEEKKVVNISAVITETIKFLKATVPATTNIKSNISHDCGHVLGSKIQIHQILVNLALNAQHAMQEGGGKVLEINLEEMRLDPGEVGSLPDGSYARLTVSDTGCGMNIETIEKIFDPFFTTKGTGKGTGLGLSVVHGIVKSYGGDVLVESKPGKGSKFSVYLPVVEGEVEEEAQEEEIVFGIGEHILFIDDEESLCTTGKYFLEDHGYKVTVKTSSEEALKVFEANPHSFDLVITDQTMVGITGLELSRKLKDIRVDIPIILTSGFTKKDMDEEEIKKSGISRFVKKPVGIDEVGRTIREVLSERVKE